MTPLDAAPGTVAEDPWMLADTLYSPCYIGGWTAAGHWGLTEQLFRSTFVFTATHVRRREQTALGADFHLVRVSRRRVESVEPTWRGSVRVRVSSAVRTIVDALVNPTWMGGVRHAADVFLAYKESEGANPAALAEELRRHGTGAAHKRAGWLATQLWPEASALLSRARLGRTTGTIKLDPAVARRGRMNKHWGLWVNVTVGAPSERS